MGQSKSLAEKYRAHKKAFDLALELGCTPKEAQKVIEQRAARKRWDDIAARLKATQEKLTAADYPPIHVADESADSEPWMMRR